MPDRQLDQLAGVGAEDIPLAWPMVQEFIETACQTTRGRWTPESIFDGLTDRRLQLWVAIQDTSSGKCRITACAVTEINNYPGKKVCTVMFGCGDGRENWQHHMATIEAWAREQGCNAIEAVARKGWAKLLDWDFTHVFIEKEL